MKRSSFTKLNLKNNRTGIHQYYYLVVIKDLPVVICLCLLLDNGSASCQIIQWLGSLGSGRIFDRLKILITAETLFTRNRWIFLRCSNEAVEPLYFQAKRGIRRLVNPCSQSFFLFISMVISYIFKGGHFHKPLLASMGSLASSIWILWMYFIQMWQNDNKNNNTRSKLQSEILRWDYSITVWILFLKRRR